MNNCGRKPNILICGTPGTGKSSVCNKLIEKLNDYKCIELSEFCRKNSCIESRDEQLDCDVINEELLLNKLQPLLIDGGLIIDYHNCSDLFPKQLIDVVFIMRCNNTILYDRLSTRNYNEEKIKNNIECEIFEMIFEETFDWIENNDLIFQLTNETQEDLDKNCAQIQKWIQNFKSK